jgi:hypothetical protein
MVQLNKLAGRPKKSIQTDSPILIEFLNLFNFESLEHACNKPITIQFIKDNNILRLFNEQNMQTRFREVIAVHTINILRTHINTEKSIMTLLKNIAIYLGYSVETSVNIVLNNVIGKNVQTRSYVITE